jgi:hypothetical protein
MPPPIIIQQPIPPNLQQQDPFLYAREPITHVKRELPHSIPVPEPPAMEATNPSSSGVPSGKETFENWGRSLEQQVGESQIVTTKKLLKLAKELGVNQSRAKEVWQRSIGPVYRWGIGKRENGKRAISYVRWHDRRERPKRLLDSPPGVPCYAKFPDVRGKTHAKH